MENKNIRKIRSIEDLSGIKEESLKNKCLGTDSGKKYKINLHLGTCGIAAGADDIGDYITGELKKRDKDKIILNSTGCLGFCALEPMLTLESYNMKPVIYHSLNKEKVEILFREHIDNNNIAVDLAPITDDSDLSDFFKLQESRVLRNRGRVDPFKIDDYIAYDGYLSFFKAIKDYSPDDITEIISDSGLRGRGGSGFPTGKKWEICRNAVSSSGIKYVICNGDEGDPGAFMDRNLLESDPHSVIEGMLIAAYSIGAVKGYLYIRAEYPLAVKTIENAIRQAREYGILGSNIGNSGFDFDIQVYKGAGAFVCGEETALLRSIEGKRGMPVPKPPFPADKGLYGMPTLVNNVETFSNIPQIILNGAEWFSAVGTKTSRGTKIFALAGVVKNVGLIEVPMGIKLRDIIFKIGGGITGGKKFKAVQLGGPSGGFIPEEHLDTEIDYEKVEEIGTIMGSGGMVVLDEDTCMANLTMFFMDFIQDESCGQCVPCRIGTRRMLEILKRITDGKGKKDDIEKLEKLSRVIKSSSLCGLGKTAPNTVISALRYFKDDFQEHIITQKSCKRLHRKNEKRKN